MTRPRSWRIVRACQVCVAAVYSLTCFAPPTDAPRWDVSTLQAHLAGSALLALGSDGRFAPEAVGGTAAPREVPRDRAAPLAAAFLETFGRGFLEGLQEEHGGPVDIRALEPCGRVFLAETPYEAFPPDTPPWVRRVHGSWWLVTFCGPRRDRQVSVAVSALATRVEIDDTGGVVYPFDDQSTLFLVLGIPRRLGELPPEPEHAILAASRVAGKKVVAVPRLIAPAVGSFPQVARWQIVLEQDASLPLAERVSTRVTDTLYYGVESFRTPPFSSVAAAGQPPTTSYAFPVGPRLTERVEFTIGRKSDAPILFDKIAVGKRSDRR